MADWALLETLRYDGPRGFFLLDGHLDRLAGSAGHFDFPLDRAEALRRLREAVRGRADSARVRLLLDSAGRVRVEVHPLAPEPPGPVRIRVAAAAVDSRDPFLFHKTTRRDVYRERLAAHPGFHDVLLVNERGEVTESTLANVVVFREGRGWTPPVSAGLLPGVFRQYLLHGGQIGERTLIPPDLRNADAVYLINSVREWRRATLVWEQGR